MGGKALSCAHGTAPASPPAPPPKTGKAAKTPKAPKKPKAPRAWTDRVEVFRLLPTKAQHRLLDEALAATRSLYNAALEHLYTGLSHWHQRGKFKPRPEPVFDSETGKRVYVPNTYFPTSFDLYKALTAIRADDPDWARWPATLLRGTTDRAVDAFARFYARKREGLKGGRPRFKGANRWRSLEFSDLIGIGIQWGASGMGAIGTHRVAIKGIGGLRMRAHRALPLGAVVTGITLVRTAGGVWQAHVAHKSPKELRGESEPATLAFDWNIGDLAVGSDGFRLPNPRRGKRAEKKRRRLARAVSRSQKGSKRRRKTVARLARAYEAEANARRTARHTGAARLIRHAVHAGHKGMAVEIADWAGLLTKFALPKDRDAPVEPWDTPSARKRRRKALKDAALGTLCKYVQHKAESAGLSIHKVPAPGTTQECARCARRAKVRLTLADRVYACRACGHRLDRDENSAQTVLRRARRGLDPRPSPKAPWVLPEVGRSHPCGNTAGA